MTVTINLTPEDLLNLRFAYSPLLELSSSFRVLVNPAAQLPYRRWVDEAQRSLHDVDLPHLSTLISPRHYIPDFLTPTPNGTRMTLEDEINRLLALPDDVIRQDVQTLIELTGDSDMRRSYIAYPREMLWCLVDELRLYWQRTLAYHWPYISSVLEGDVIYRAQRLALDGVTGLFENLHPRMTYHSGQIEIDKPQHVGEFSLDGHGLHFAPVVFAASTVRWQIVPAWQPMIMYTPRGVGQWRQQPPKPDESLEVALGVGRARVLAALVTPLTTGELAQRLNLTAGAVSQHLARLQQAGLVNPHRSGKRVYYQLTARGEQLLALFKAA